MRSDFYNMGGSSTQNNFNNKNPFKSNRKSTLDFGTFNSEENKKAFSGFIDLAKRKTNDFAKDSKKTFKEMFNVFRDESKDSTEEFGENFQKSVDQAKKRVDVLSKTIKIMGDNASKESKKRLDEYTKQYNEMLVKQINAEKDASKKIKLLREAGMIDDKNQSYTDKLLKKNVKSYEKYKVNDDGSISKSEQISTMKDVFTYAFDKSPGARSFFSELSNSFGNFVNNADNKGQMIVGLIGTTLAATLNVFLNKFFDRFNKGIDNIADTYESTFHEVAILSTHTQSTYIDSQNDMKSFLKENNLDSVIKISDVMSSMHDAVMSGITDQGKAQNIALQNSITKAINPFIDTQSDAYKDLQLALGDKFVDSSNGIIEAVNRNVGQTRFVSKNLNDMLSKFEPVIMNAKSDQFDKQFADVSAKLEAAVKSGQMTSSQAEDLKQSLYNVTMDQYNTLQNGNVAEISTISKMIQQGIDPSQDLSRTLKTLVSQNADIMSLANTSGANGTLNRNIMADNGLVSSGAEWWADRDSANDIIKAITETNIESSEKYQKTILDRLGDTFTSLFKKDTKAENSSLSAGQFKQTYPDAFDALQSIINILGSISTTVAGIALGKLGTSLFSKISEKTTETAVGKFGSKVLNKINDKLPDNVIGNFIKKFTEKGTKETAEHVGKELTEEAIKKATKEATEEAGENILKEVAKNTAKEGAETVAEEGAKKLSKEALEEVVKQGAKETTEEAIKKASKEVAEETAEQVIKNGSKSVAKNATKASGIGAILGFAIDGISGIFKANEYFKDKNNGKNSSIIQKGESAIAGAIAGDGPGIGQDGSNFSKVLNVGTNAAKWASAGAALGTVIPGIGNIAGAVGGAVLGTITAAIGPERIAKGLDSAKDTIGNGFRKFMNGIGEAKDFVVSKASEAGDSIHEGFNNFVDKLGEAKDYTIDKVNAFKDGIGEGFNNFVDNLSSIKDSTIENISNGFNWFKDGLSDIGEGASNIFSSITNIFKKDSEKALKDSEEAQKNSFEFGSNIKDFLSNTLKSIPGVESIMDFFGISDKDTKKTHSSKEKSTEKDNVLKYNVKAETVNILNKDFDKIFDKTDSLNSNVSNILKKLNNILETNNNLSGNISNIFKSQENYYQNKAVKGYTSESVNKSTVENLNSMTRVLSDISSSVGDINRLINSKYENLIKSNPSDDVYNGMQGNTLSKSSSIEKTIKDAAQYIVKAIMSVNDTISQNVATSKKVVDTATGLVNPRPVSFSESERTMATVVPRSF